MAIVLFIITLPTAAEELRLDNESSLRSYNASPSSQMDGRSTTNQSTTTLAINSLTGTTSSIDNAGLAQTPTPSIQILCNEPEVMSLGVGKTLDTRPNTPLSHQNSTKGDKSDVNSKSTARANSQSTSDTIKDALDMDDAPVSRKSWEGLRDILHSARSKSSKKSDPFELNLPNDACMERVLRKILKKFQIFNAVWTLDSEGRMHQIIFTVELNEHNEHILDYLHEWGIGHREGSTVSVLNCIVSKTFTQRNEPDTQNECKSANSNAQKQSVWNRFMNSVRSRLNVVQIVRDVRQDATITFDFLILLISAAILASFGLVEDSTIFLASSMLISPLMGPIIAGIFGTAIKDSALRSLGLKNELIGILLATVVGFLFGLIICTIDDRYGIGEGITTEMISRCEVHSLVVGLFTAIPSGAAAAVAVLGGNIGSLVGVAISASLLPPAVNSGLLWALALLFKFYETDDTRYNNVVKSNSYSDNQAAELAILGTLSMCVTISNIVCVYIMGVLVLKVKEIAPLISQNNREFWKRDIKIARGLIKNGIGTDTALIDEYANLPQEDRKILGIDCNLLRNIRLDDPAYQNTWSPIGNRHSADPSGVRHDSYSTVHQIERLYSSLTQREAMMHRRNRFSLARQPTIFENEYGQTNTPRHEKLARRATIPTKAMCPKISVTSTNETSSIVLASSQSSSTTTSGLEERKIRKFVVTPTEGGQIQFPTDCDEVDV